MNEQLIDMHLEEWEEGIYGNPDHPEHKEYQGWKEKQGSGGDYTHHEIEEEIEDAPF